MFPRCDAAMKRVLVLAAATLLGLLLAGGLPAGAPRAAYVAPGAFPGALAAPR